MTPLKLLFFVCEEGQTRLDFLLNFFKKNDRQFYKHSSFYIYFKSSRLNFLQHHARFISLWLCFHSCGGAQQHEITITDRRIPGATLPSAGGGSVRPLFIGKCSTTGTGMGEAAVSWSSHCVNEGSPCDCAGDGVEGYEKCFKDGEVLPVPELVGAVEPRTLSFVVTDIGTGRLAGMGEETFEDLLKAAGVPGRCFCRGGFAAWDVLLPSEEVTKGLAGGGIATRFFRLQPEY